MLHSARSDNRCGDGGVDEDERDRELDQRNACVVGELRELLGGVELALVRRQRQIEALGKSCGARGAGLIGPLAPAARQSATGQPAVGHDAHAVFRAGGQHVGFDAPHEDRVRRLLGHEALQVPVARRPLRSTIAGAGTVAAPM
jgi:hypothetical protein